MEIQPKKKLVCKKLDASSISPKKTPSSPKKKVHSPSVSDTPCVTEEQQESLEGCVQALSQSFTRIIPREELVGLKHGIKFRLDWGANGIGDRWAQKKYNYSVVYRSGATKTYSENDDDTVDKKLVATFLKSRTSISKGIIGIFVHSPRITVVTRPIRADIKREIVSEPCVNCGTSSEIVCDHKNDMYNDPLVLSTKTQTLDDFQPLCTHCNLQKRQIAKEEKETQKPYSAKQMARFKIYPFAFPWEKYSSTYGKKDSYWYDPIEFQRKIYIYSVYVRPLLVEIKHRK
jgi:hypothetical protein